MASRLSVDYSPDNEFTLEARVAPPSHLLAKIKSFSKLSKHGISKFESAEFEAGDYKWKVIIYPDGDEVGKKVDHISVYLSMVGTSSLPAGWDVTAIFNFFIYNHNSDNYLCFRGRARRFQDINTEIRFSKLLGKETLSDPCNGYILDDVCVFGAEVFVIKNHGRYIESFSVFDVQRLCEREWEISNFSKLKNAWTSENFSAGGYNWQIMLYPNGSWTVEGHYVSVFLYCIDSKSFASHKKVKVNCLFTLKKTLQDQKSHSMKASDWYTCSADIWGFPEFKAIRDLHDEGFLVKDCCHLKIQLSVEAVQEALN